MLRSFDSAQDKLLLSMNGLLLVIGSSLIFIKYQTTIGRSRWVAPVNDYVFNPQISLPVKMKTRKEFSLGA